MLLLYATTPQHHYCMNNTLHSDIITECIFVWFFFCDVKRKYIKLIYIEENYHFSMLRDRVGSGILLLLPINDILYGIRNENVSTLKNKRVFLCRFPLTMAMDKKEFLNIFNCFNSDIYVPRIFSKFSAI